MSYEESVITFQGSIAAIVSESVEACDRSVVFYTYNEAKAVLALAKLRQLLRVWCEGQEWGEVKYSLYWDDEVEGVAISETGQGSLRFPSLKLAMGFVIALKTFCHRRRRFCKEREFILKRGLLEEFTPLASSFCVLIKFIKFILVYSLLIGFGGHESVYRKIFFEKSLKFPKMSVSIR